MQERSKGGSVIEIESLTVELNQVTSAFDRWNEKIIIAMVVTAIATVALVVFQYLAIKAAKRAAEVQGLLVEAKDRQLALALKEKDEHIAIAQKEADEARMQAEKIKAAIAWREISPDKALILEQTLVTTPGTVLIQYTDGDPEALNLALQIARIFMDSKWQTSTIAARFHNKLVFGLCIPDDSSESSQRLKAAFNSAGISFSSDKLPPALLIGFGGPTQEPVTTIMVGSKPPSLLSDKR